MSEGDAAGEARPHPRQLITHIPKHQMIGVGYAIRMGRHLPVEDINLPLRQHFPEVVEGAAVAEAELQNDAVHSGNETGGFRQSLWAISRRMALSSRLTKLEIPSRFPPVQGGSSSSWVASEGPAH